ncbi:MAG: cytoplasmic protein [Candidatus Omnitrophota bacterium]
MDGYDYYEDQQDNSQYKDFIATRLYCSNCKESMPVFERLLLILPDGNLFEYICQQCKETLGDKKTTLDPKDKLLF